MISLLTIAQIVIPPALLAWLALGRPRTRTGWLARTLLVGGWLVAINVAGLWTAYPQAIGWVWLVASVPLAVLAFRRTRKTAWWPSDRPGGRDGTDPGRPDHASATTPLRLFLARAGTVAIILAAAGMLFFAGRTLSWKGAPDGPAVELAFPLRAGTYLVVNGGSSNVNNGHFGIPERALERYRGQTRAVDLIRVDALGRRSDGFRPADPAAYRIFGDTIHAPCAGTVVLASDGLADLSPPEVDREHMAGNHVVLECDGAAPGLAAPAGSGAPPTSDSATDPDVIWVLLGHLKQGSVRVAEGDTVVVGQPLGQVGNTGNSDEPHLHIHAQRPGTRENPFGAEPLVVRFDGRFLSRNDRVRSGGQAEIRPGAGSR